MNQNDIEKLLLSFCKEFKCDCHSSEFKCNSCKKLEFLIRHYKLAEKYKEILSPNV
jgi:hypothetical protein